MEQITISYVPIQSLGYVICDVPKDIMEITQEYIDDLIETKFQKAIKTNTYLAGAIEHEYNLGKLGPYLNSFFEKIIPEYFKITGNISLVDKKFKVSTPLYESSFEYDIWVNIQKKHEYNPIHKHKGLVSFVYYVKIPYSMSEEKTFPSIRDSNTNNLPAFSFIYPNHSYYESLSAVGEHKILIDKSYEGKMLLFPSALQHSVTPFHTSDNYRISVAGNIVQAD